MVNGSVAMAAVRVFISLSGSHPSLESAPEFPLLDPSGETALFSVNITHSSTHTNDQEQPLIPMEVGVVD